jgi:integrase
LLALTALAPSERQVEPVAWWCASVVIGQMTGCRISVMTALEGRDVGLDAGRAITRASDDKGKRDHVAALHSIVVDHLHSQTFVERSPP